jgi:hypothetical protein
MSENSLIPIWFYKDFTKRDWPKLPKVAQNALAAFLLQLQQDPSNIKILSEAQRDTKGRLGFEFSPGYVVYWEVGSGNGFAGQQMRIEVLAVASAEIKFSRAPEVTAGANSVPEEELDSIKRVFSRNARLGNLAMWGTLHASVRTGNIKGWLVDSWSERGWPALNPKMHWVSFPDYKLRHVSLSIDVSSTMQVGPEDRDVEPQRLIFVRSTLTQWEQEWLEQQNRSSG